MYVLTPIVIPFGSGAIIDSFNKWFLDLQVRLARNRLRMGPETVVFVFSQNWYPFVQAVRRRKLIYYVVDEQSGFSGVDRLRFEQLNRNMCELADLVICSAKKLVDRYRPLNPNTHQVSHGVNHNLFSSVLSGGVTTIPERLRGLTKPVLGFWGHISHDWVDADLLKNLAGEKPDWTILLIGRNDMAPSEFQDYPNIVLTGEVEYNRLPDFCSAVDVGLIPFVKSPLTENCNPLKLYEYLSAGLPVVSTDIPEVRNWRDHVLIAGDNKSFIRCCEEALRPVSDQWRKERSDLMKQNTWEQKVQNIYELVGD